MTQRIRVAGIDGQAIAAGPALRAAIDRVACAADNTRLLAHIERNYSS